MGGGKGGGGGGRGGGGPAPTPTIIPATLGLSEVVKVLDYIYRHLSLLIHR